MNELDIRHFELVCQSCQRRVRCCETETDLRLTLRATCPECWQGPRCREFNEEAGIG